MIYEDSVAPLHQAGQVVLWDGQHRIDEHLTLESAPGHTPGPSVLRLASRGERALGRAADERELLVPAHFGGTGVVEVRRDGDRFALAPPTSFEAERA
ncbi:beta-lactamase [[Actinomadura] parvosata subsp. kistnae]|uniref:Metallo-beta-lactamase domain-containing protein n=1 Tax=[Actinomadura] parvosata subsp. kistnae TaxID=1909395 RepID=A0A1V0A071_9ACTN|nr:hypothetical protein [Nonomuraea sp. ATCC 55076]AQZ63598.1 hypothetical protein BKM31_20955 [Nonomuraea sp. ATCC 55076]SPL99373.1 beta-lactamase [Actinomadura parvosata subsp. kistnae]